MFIKTVVWGYMDFGLIVIGKRLEQIKMFS